MFMLMCSILVAFLCAVQKHKAGETCLRSSNGQQFSARGSYAPTHVFLTTLDSEVDCNRTKHNYAHRILR